MNRKIIIMPQSSADVDEESLFLDEASRLKLLLQRQHKCLDSERMDRNPLESSYDVEVVIATDINNVIYDIGDSRGAIVLLSRALTHKAEDISEQVNKDKVSVITRSNFETRDSVLYCNLDGSIGDINFILQHAYGCR